MKRFLFILGFWVFAGICAADEPTPGYTELLKIDAHSHVFEDIPAYNELLLRINARTVNIY